VVSPNDAGSILPFRSYTLTSAVGELRSCSGQAFASANLASEPSQLGPRHWGQSRLAFWPCDDPCESGGSNEPMTAAFLGVMDLIPA
jgi:hypothetical protein